MWLNVLILSLAFFRAVWAASAAVKDIPWPPKENFLSDPVQDTTGNKQIPKMGCITG